MKQVLGIRDEKTRMKVTLPLAMAPVTQDDDMRWNPKQHRAGDAKVTAPPTPRKRRRGATQAAGLLVDAAIRQG